MVTNIMIRAYVWAQGVRDSAVTSLKEDSGQDLVEYAVLVGAIGIVAAVALFAATPFQDALTTFVDKIAACITFDAANCNAN